APRWAGPTGCKRSSPAPSSSSPWPWTASATGGSPVSRYKDKVTIITGGTKGIGLGCVRVFVEEGGSNVVFCARNVNEGKSLEAEFSSRGPGRATFVRCDVSKVDEIRALIDHAVKQYGRIDCLINNAGWHPPHKPIDDFSVQDFRDLIELNVVSIF